MAQDQVQSIASHLDGCDECRLEVHRLSYAIGTKRELLPDPGLLERMQAAIDRWEESAGDGGRSAEAVKTRVAAELGPFLGGKATARMLEPISDAGENLLCDIEPVLALFLGCRAAGCLVDHVVDSSLIRA